MARDVIDSFSGEDECYSNFYISEAAYDGIIYPTSEHAYQAAKTDDPELRKWVYDAPTPHEAKKRGRKLGQPADWHSRSLGIMEAIVYDKFTRNRELGDKLIATGCATLVEGNWWGDTFWGVCKGVGENHLGKTLMKVRHRITIERELAKM